MCGEIVADIINLSGRHILLDKNGYQPLPVIEHESILQFPDDIDILPVKHIQLLHLLAIHEDAVVHESKLGFCSICWTSEFEMSFYFEIKADDIVERIEHNQYKDPPEGSRIVHEKIEGSDSRDKHGKKQCSVMDVTVPDGYFCIVFALRLKCGSKSDNVHMCDPFLYIMWKNY